MIRDIKIPMEKRAFFNEKALAVANGVDAGSVTREDVAMCFSGKGNLNDLERKDYSNFHQYRAARNEMDQGQHFVWLFYNMLNICNTKVVQDKSCILV